MRTIAALFLAALLAVLGYGIFWMISLEYTTAQMKGTLEKGLQARVSYGQPQWVPDVMHVTMDMPAPRVEFSSGPVQSISAPTLRLSSDFFRRDRWVIELPERVEVTLAQGRKLVLETRAGRVMWIERDNSMTLKAESVRVLDLAGNELVSLGDVVLERGINGGAIDLNLASRPQWQGGEAVVSGKMQVPAASFAAMVNLFGEGRVPHAGALVRAASGALRPGDVVDIKTLSVKTTTAGQSTTAAVFGRASMTRDYQLLGEMTFTSDKSANLARWVRTSGVLAPRNDAETIGANGFLRGLSSVGTIRMGNMQMTLTLNGQPVGPLPKLNDVVSRLWPM